MKDVFGIYSHLLQSYMFHSSEDQTTIFVDIQSRPSSLTTFRSVCLFQLLPQATSQHRRSLFRKMLHQSLSKLRTVRPLLGHNSFFAFQFSGLCLNEGCHSSKPGRCQESLSARNLKTHIPPDEGYPTLISGGKWKS